MCGLGVAHTPFREKGTVMSGLGLPALPFVKRDRYVRAGGCPLSLS